MFGSVFTTAVEAEWGAQYATMCHSNHPNPSRPGKESESHKHCQYFLQFFFDDKTARGYIACRICAIGYF